MDILIEQFENETELPATWNNGGMGGYTKEYTEWLAEKAVNKNDLSQRVSGSAHEPGRCTADAKDRCDSHDCKECRHYR